MIQIIIKGQQVDIDKSVGLYLTKQFETISNPTLYHSEFSKTITLPMTAKNRRIFEQFQRMDSVVTTESIDPRKKIPYQLLYNSEMVMEGYLKINNSNTIITDNRFEVELYGTFGLIMNELKQLTFNKYETQEYGGDKDDKYLINTPWQNILVNASLVKNSFEREGHNLNGNDILDYVKIFPTYQGKYPDFESDKVQWHPSGLDMELEKERDEHYMREFRSYYQQAGVWVDKLWKLAQNKINSITDYRLKLDPTWFNNSNPYWTDLLYTCPNLYTPDENFVDNMSVFDENSLHYRCQIKSMDNLSSYHRQTLMFSPEGTMYRSGICNPDLKGPTKFTMNSSIMLCAKRQWSSSVTYAKIRKENPLFVTFNVIKEGTNWSYASKTYMIYSNRVTDLFTSNMYDERINVGVTRSDSPNISGSYPQGYTKYSGWWWEAPINVELEVTSNIRYYVTMNVRFANNSKAVEYSSHPNINWDLLWEDWFFTSPYYDSDNGYIIFNCLKRASCQTIDYQRSRSKIDLYRVFPKDTTLYDVLLNYSKMFGLMWDIDEENKTITVMSRNRYFLGHNIKDWSNKIDRSKDFKLEPLCFNKRFVSFNTEDGSGQRYETYKNKYGVGYGSKKIDTEYTFNSDTEELYKGIQPAIISQKAQYSLLYNTDDPNADDFVGYGYQVYPKEFYLDNDNNGENAGNSGAFVFCNGTMKPDPYLGYRNSSGEGVIYITDDTEMMKRKNCYMWNLSSEGMVATNKIPHIDTVNKSGAFSVLFNKPAEYYYKGNYNYAQYIYDLFWRRFIDERYSVQNKKLTCYVYLTPAEYKGINFREFVKIGNNLYHINKVYDYDFDTNSPVKVELCQVWDVSAYTHGQHAWPSLVVDPDFIEIDNNRWWNVGVYSNDEWYVDRKPSWVRYEIDEDDLKLKGMSDPLNPRSGEVVLKNQSGLTASIWVLQRPSRVFLNLSSNNATVENGGATIDVYIDSRPTTVRVDSKPTWCNVEITERPVPFLEEHLTEEVQTRAIPTTATAIHYMPSCSHVATITVRPNYFIRSRSGIISFTNGTITKNFTVNQLGGKLIVEHYDDTPMHIDLNESGLWELNSYKEIDPKTVNITSGTVTPPNTNVAYAPISFTPQLDTVDHGDGTPETCTGGQVSILTKDGMLIWKNYNYGTVTPTYEVQMNTTEGGHYVFENTDYYGPYMMDMVSGTTFTLTAVEDNGQFERWSNGETTSTITVTVTGDMEIYPIFTTSDSYEFDNEDIIRYDNNNNIKI